MDQRFAFGFWVGLAAFVLLVSSCAERADQGEEMELPSVSFVCATSHCRTNASANIFVRVTQSSCDPQYADFAKAVSSIQVQCNGSTGCSGTAAVWRNAQGVQVTKIPSGTYSICGQIDYGTITSSGDDTLAASENISLSGGSKSIQLSNWRDP